VADALAVADGLTVADGLAVGLTVADGLAVAVGLAVVRAVLVAAGLVPLAESFRVAFASPMNRRPRTRPTAIVITRGTAISMIRLLRAPDGDQCLLRINPPRCRFQRSQILTVDQWHALKGCTGQILTIKAHAASTTTNIA
jgi:hypothetical protein